MSIFAFPEQVLDPGHKWFPFEVLLLSLLNLHCQNFTNSPYTITISRNAPARYFFTFSNKSGI